MGKNTIAIGSKKFFDTEHLKPDLKGRSVRGGAVTMAAQIIKFLLQTGSTVILAHLLTPQDYGLFAMVTAITGFVALFKDMGLSMATIQKADITHSQVSSLFWINVAISFLLALILAMVAPIISWFYREPRLTWITIALAGTFLLSGLTVQHQALLARQMLFKAIALIEIGSLFISVVTGIILAICGADYWALAGLAMSSALSYMILTWALCRWRPSLPIRGAGIFSMVKFGMHMTGFDIVNYFARNFDSILLGRYWGANVLGLYSRAYSIMMLPISQVRAPLNAVAIPALSHLQDDPMRFKKYFIKLITLIAFITMPLAAFLFVCADQAIYLLLGSQWIGAATIFKILCLNAFVQPVLGTAGLVLISLGQSKRYLIIGILNSIVIIISFILGLHWGAIGVAIAYTTAIYILFIPTLRFCFKKTPISTIEFLSALLRPLIASLVMGFLILAIRPYFADLSAIISIGCSCLSGFLIYLITLICLPGGVLLLREFVSFRNFIFQKKGA